MGYQRLASATSVLAMVASSVVLTIAPVPLAPFAGVAEASTTAILVDGSCTLNDAVAAANSGSTVGSCANDSASTLIRVAANPISPSFDTRDAVGTIVDAVDGSERSGGRTALPTITADITIEGIDHAGIYSGFDSEPTVSRPRLAYVASGGSLTLRDTTVAGFDITGAASSAESCDLSDENDLALFCYANDGVNQHGAQTADGGAIYADGDLLLDGVVMHDNAATGGASGFREVPAGSSTLPERAPRGGGDARGGAIYATGTVTIVDSVFHSNGVTGRDGTTGIGVNTNGSFFAEPDFRDGGSGGDAFGADVAFGASSSVTIRRTLFEGSRAEGGDGAFGSTSNTAKNLELPPRAADGARGTCDRTPTQSEANGKNGHHGIDGGNGATGGDGGHARGAIHTAGSLELDSVTIIDATAVGGAAGSAGLPEIGGEAGDGGDGRNCSTGRRGSLYGGGGDIVRGDGGDGGSAGRHGEIRPNGARAVAVSAVSGTTGGTVLVRNSSFLDNTATISADNIDEFALRDDLLAALGRVNPLIGLGGDEQESDNRGSDGTAGPGANLNLLRSQPRPGDVAVFFVGLRSEVAFTSFAGNTNNQLATDTEHADVTVRDRLLGVSETSRRLPPSPIALQNSLVGPNTVGTTSCAVRSGGNNAVREDARCWNDGPGDQTTQSFSLISSTDATGPKLTTDGFGTSWRLITRNPTGPPAFANAVDVDTDGCTTLDGGVVERDARGVPRNDGACDAGANERAKGFTTDIEFADPQSHLMLPLRTASLADQYEVERIDITYDAPAGSPEAIVTVTAAELVGRLRCVGFACSKSERFGPDSLFATEKIVSWNVSPQAGVQSFDISIEATGNAPVDMSAELDTGFSVSTDAISFEVPYRPNLVVSETGGASVVSRCAGSMAFNYELDVVGTSQFPSSFLLDVAPKGDVLAPRIKSGGGSITSTVEDPDVWRWRPDPLDRASDSASIQVLDRPGDYAAGEVVVPSIEYLLPPGSPIIVVGLPTTIDGAPRTIAPAPQFEVTFSGLAGIVTGETREVTVDVMNNAAACGSVTGVTFDVGDGAGGVALDETIGALAGGSSQQFTFDFTAPVDPDSISFPFAIDFDHSELAGGPIADAFGFSLEAAPPIPTVTAPAGPLNDAAVVFDVVFDRDVTGFGDDDVILLTDTGATTATVAPGSGPEDTYTVTVSGMTTSGIIEVGVRSGAALFGDVSSAPSNRDSVIYDLDGPITIVNWEPNGPFVLSTPITFNVDVIDEDTSPPPGVIELSDLVVSGTAQPSNVSISEIAPVFGPGSRTFQVSIATVANPGSVDVRVLPASTVDHAGNPSTVGELEFQSPTVEYIEVPEPPVDVVAVAGDGEVEVSWSPGADDGGLDLDSYEIEMTTEPAAGTPVWTQVASGLDPDVLTATVTGLTNGDDVAFRVLARNAIDASDPSAASAAVTPNPLPTVTVAPAPGQEDPTSSEPIEFAVEFSAAVSGFDAADVTLAGTVGIGVVAVDPDATGTPGQSYIVTLSGITGQGPATVSVPAGVATRATGQPNLASEEATVVYDTVAPTAFVALAPGQEAVTDDPTIDFLVDFDEPVTGFDAADLSIAGTAGGTVDAIAPLDDGYVVTVEADLSEGTVQLVVGDEPAVDIAGFSASVEIVTDTVEVVSIPGAPGTPSGFAADGLVELDWTAPTVDGGRDIVLYEVEQSTDGGATWTPAVTESGTEYIETLGVVIDGLTNDIGIQFRVSAFNGVGQGPWSAPSPSLTPTEPPVATVSLAEGQAPESDDGEVRVLVEFDDPVEGLSPEGVYVFGEPDVDDIVVTGSGTTWEVLITRVTRPGEIEILVGNDAAVNANGQGNTESNSVFFVHSGPATDPWVGLVGARYLETRIGPNQRTFDGLQEGIGRRTAGELTEVMIGGRGLVPVSATGVIVNVTAVNPSDVGFLTAWSCVGERPTASSLNYSPGVTVGNEVLLQLGAAGELCVFTSSETDLVVDVVGYVDETSTVVSLSPARLVETRIGATLATIDGEVEGIGTLAAGDELTIPVVGRAGVPADAASVIVNVTAIRPEAVGFFTMHPCLDELPLASSLNYVPGVNRGNEVIVELDDDGNVCLFTSSATEMTLDIVGYLPAEAAALPIGPARLLDTRSGDGIDTIDGDDLGGGPLAAGTVRQVVATGRAGVPDSALSVVVNVTAIRPAAVGFLTIWPCEAEQPLAASLNYVPGVSGGSEIIVPVDSEGKICVFTSAQTDLAIDITAATDP